MTISALKTVSGMNVSIVTPYDFADIGWYNDQYNPNCAKWRHLNSLIVQVDTEYYLKDKATKRWTKHPDRASATRTVTQMYAGMIDLAGVPQVITADDIKSYVSAGVITFQRTVYAPGMGDFVTFNGEKCLNTYSDERLEGDTDHVLSAEPLLKIIRGSLCNQPTNLDLGEMIDEITGEHLTPFKWVMHWLAARYQMPGFCPMTNLWFIGKQRGTGKGTVVNAMRGVLGSRGVGKANQADVAKGWTNSLQGHELVEWDEFKSPGGWREFNNLLKEATGNSTIKTNQRNVGGSIHPNVAMHLFTTNEERPILVEANDRQNTFIATTDDVAWREKAIALYDEVTGDWADPDMLSGFAALLNAIEIDIAMVRKPFKAKLFKDLAAGSADTIEQWIDEGEVQILGGYLPWGDLHIVYRDWVKDHLHAKHDDLKEFKRKMIRGGYASDGVRKVKDGFGGTKSMRCALLSLPDYVAAGEEICNRPFVLPFER